MDSVIKPETLADVFDNKIEKLSTWLSQQETLESLSKVIGLNLSYASSVHITGGELEDDLLLNNNQDGSFISVVSRFEEEGTGLIEKALAHASSYWSKAVICIAPSFSYKELNTIDWLNGHSASNVRFYAVTLEASKAGEEISGTFTAKTQLTDGMLRGLCSEFWAAYYDYYEAKTGSRYAHTYGHPTGRVFTGSIALPCKATLIFEPKLNRVGVAATIVAKDGKREDYYDSFYALKDEIAAAFPEGITLTWSGKPSCDIAIYLEGAAPYDRSRWNEYFEWMLANIDIVDKVFQPFIRRVRGK